ncbi:hypothetical protein [Tsukamurella paurometabola]|uniref:Lipoprotein n=1 Tax=Tsukamurella paurometabola TaxID=2061 RepID=A0ABS5NEE6_TSUPA|nr:hypothetical protein [Tsukamurella paurometabola]MBS4101828.1 hypothetical protein [Tsukamurella paurometabola]
MDRSSIRRPTGFLAALVIVGGGVPGCATTVAGTPVAGQATTGAPTFSPGPDTPLEAPSNAAPNPARLAGIWTGTYVCNQGATALSLTLADPASGPSRFDFSATPGNPGVPSGAYTITMSLDGADLVLTPLAWVNRPGNYEMVGLRVTGPIDSATTLLAGSVTYPGCTTFEVRRKGAQ